jgi:TetR/AcrR family transcriptional regulator, lmrAB and yxaGH operons repressor
MTEGSTRDRLVSTMSASMQRHGLHGTGISEVLRDASAPKGVLYHHFPRGKTELALAAIDASTATAESWLDVAFSKHPDPLEAVERWLAAASRRLEASAFEAGCPLATIALETTSADVEVRARLAENFERLRNRIDAALVAGGIQEQDAKGLATLIIAAYEGGLLQARIAGSTKFLVQTSDTLLSLVRARRASSTPS